MVPGYSIGIILCMACTINLVWLAVGDTRNWPFMSGDLAAKIKIKISCKIKITVSYDYLQQ